MTPLAKSVPIFASDASRFVKEYYAALSKSDVAAVLLKFAESVSYSDRPRDHAFIEKDLRDYVTRWPVLNLKPEAVAVSPKDDGSTVITFDLIYSVANERNKKSLSGHSTNTWIVQRVRGDIQIVSQRELVHPNPVPADIETFGHTGGKIRAQKYRAFGFCHCARHRAFAVEGRRRQRTRRLRIRIQSPTGCRIVRATPVVRLYSLLCD